MKPASLVSSLRYFSADAWDEWRHSPGVNLLALGTLTSTLFVAGLVLLVLSNLQHQLTTQRDHVLVHVYLVEGAEPEVRQQLERRVADMQGVQQVTYVDKAEALRIDAAA